MAEVLSSMFFSLSMLFSGLKPEIAKAGLHNNYLLPIKFVILFVRRCSDLCFFTPTNFSFVSNAGNRSISFK